MYATRTLAVVVLCASLGACAPAPVALPYTLKDYQQGVARRIVQTSAQTYIAPLPDVMKSIVVLEITVDAAGQATAVSVLRSNGYAHLEQRALASVAKAAPFTPPAPALLRGAQSVSFLETFLFRDDDFFQVRSLVPNEKLF
jgi:TonB family protein